MQIKITVKFFGPFRRVAGSGSIEMTVPEKTSLADLLADLQELYPDIQRNLETALPLVNRRKESLGEILKNGDVITFIPQVSGG